LPKLTSSIAGRRGSEETQGTSVTVAQGRAEGDRCPRRKRLRDIALTIAQRKAAETQFSSKERRRSCSRRILGEERGAIVREEISAVK